MGGNKNTIIIGAKTAKTASPFPRLNISRCPPACLVRHAIAASHRSSSFPKPCLRLHKLQAVVIEAPLATKALTRLLAGSPGSPSPPEPPRTPPRSPHSPEPRRVVPPGDGPRPGVLRRRIIPALTKTAKKGNYRSVPVGFIFMAGWLFRCTYTACLGTGMSLRVNRCNKSTGKGQASSDILRALKRAL